MSKFFHLTFVALLACAGNGGDSDAGTDGATDAESDGSFDGSFDTSIDTTSDVLVDAGLPDVADAGAERTCVGVTADPTGTDVIEDPNGRATVTVSDRDECRRSYTLSTTAALRDDRPDNPRVLIEQPLWPTTRTGNDMFDALHALALDEVRECSVDEIRDFAFNDGDPVSCGEGGCFETGRLWSYVWTRDTAYAVDLGLAAMDPTRARNSLEFKLSERRGGGDLQVVQDTGSGGSYPISTDRVSWAMGAWTLLQYLDGSERDDFAARALEALSNTLEHDRTIAYDSDDGLYRGEQSFLDWREQSYPEWTATDVVHLGMSKSLSTNLLHFNAMQVAASLADEAGDTTLRDRYQGWADALSDAIVSELWLEEEGLFSTFSTTTLDPSATRRFDLLGSALAVLLGVADDARAARVLESYPHYGPAAPVQWPQQQQTRIYHNRAEWPFVDAYWLRAAARADNDAVADRITAALMRGAALNLSNMENFEAATGAPWVDDGAASGPVVNSQRQLWSVAGYLAMVHRTIFGLNARPEGLAITPYVTAGMRNGIFANTDRVVLNDFPYRGRTITVVLNLPIAGASGGSYGVTERRLNGEAFPGEVVPDAMLEDVNRIDVFFGAPSSGSTLTERTDDDWRDVFQPRTPRITGVTEVGGELQLAIDRNGETDTVEFFVYRDGVRIAEDLADSTTLWTDSSADVSTSPCYSVEACFVSSGNCSQHAPPFCWWGPGAARITSFPASSFTNVGGTGSTNHGRFHYEPWGDAGHRLEVSGFTPAASGEYSFQAVYGNGAGAVDTGVTCAVKRLYVEEEGGAIVGEGALVMPHLGDWDRWGDSNFVSIALETGTTYRIVIETHDDYVNMSAFAHFETYVNAGGRDGELNHVNISELKALFRP